MSVKYVSRGIKNPITGETSYYAQSAPVDPLTIDEIVEQIEKRCTLTEPDIRACLLDFQYVVIQALRNGQSVRFGDLGSFRATITSSASDTAEDVSSDNIQKVNCRFTAGSRIRKALQLSQLSFSKTSTSTTSDEETA